MSQLVFYDDIQVSTRWTGGTVLVDKAEMLAFAKAWDPLPIHVDEEVATRVMGSLTAPGLYVLALKQRLIHQMDKRPAVIASLGYDDIRFLQPVRAGDALTLAIDWVEKRPSKSKPDRGIVVHRLSLLNANGDPAMSHLDTILVRKRPS